jgi:hypothetical protein
MEINSTNIEQRKEKAIKNLGKMPPKKDKHSHRLKIEKLVDFSKEEHKTKCISIGPIDHRINESKIKLKGSK